MQPARFHTLDALRGVAAIAVMLYHAGYQAPLLMPRGYLAADLFFVLSGFVLAHSYEQRLRDGMGLGAFLRLRLQRLYPLIWLGAVIGCLLFSGSPLMILLIPTEPSGDLMYRANAPLWSLLFELIANLVWALLAVRLGTRILIGLVAAFGAVLAVMVVMHGGADLGATWQTALPGLVRTFFSFTLGIVLHRLFERGGSIRQTTPLGWLLVPALVLPLIPFTSQRALVDLAMLGVIIPGIVWLGARWTVPDSNLVDRLGGLSYPLYCIHAPFVAKGFSSPGLMLLICTAMIGAALWLDRHYDRPIQAWLKSRKQSACPAKQALA